MFEILFFANNSASFRDARPEQLLIGIELSNLANTFHSEAALSDAENRKMYLGSLGRVRRPKSI